MATGLGSFIPTGSQPVNTIVINISKKKFLRKFFTVHINSYESVLTKNDMKYISFTKNL